MKKLGLGKRALACAVSAATLLTGTTALSAVTQMGGVTASAASYDNYAKLLQYSMYFYDANMCGAEVGETGQMEWRDDCHTGDAVTGGFHDAGDHVKFGLPAGYTASTLGWGYYEFKDSYDSLGQTAHLKTITDYFAKYFKDCTTLSGGSVSSFVYQVGNGDQDHAVWCAPEVQDASSRQVYTTTNSASDIAAEYAAALAVNYINFGNEEDLTYAKALYDFSIKYNKTADEGTSAFYNSYDYYDDQAWAAGWLYLATNDSSYKTFLNDFMNASNAGKSGQSGCKWGIYSPMSWNNVSLGAGILQGEITGSASDWQKVSTYLNGKCTSESTYYCEDSWGSCRYNTSVQLSALVASKHSSSMDYPSWSKAQMAMILGNNTINTNFVVGFDSNSAKYAHHRAASGYDSNDEMTNQVGYASDGHVLVGALVGGPTDSNFTYSDTIQDYKCNEVAIDYNAAIVGAAAGLYATYKTGSVDASIEGTKNGGVVTTATTKQTTTTTTEQTTEKTTAKTTAKTTEVTTATTQGSSSGSEASFTTGSEAGTDGSVYEYATFNPSGAKTATVYYKVNSSDLESTGAFGTWTGTEWLQEDFAVSVGSNGECSVTYTIPSNVGTEVKASVYWPGADSVEFTKIVLDEGTSPVVTTATTKKTTNNNTTTTTAAPSGADDQIANITTGTEAGESGAMQAYAEFAPAGAKSATLYYTVSSNDLETSGAFGTWTGVWEQEDFNISVPSGGSCTVDYTIPSNVGQTVKASIYWPTADSVKIEKVVLHYGTTTTGETTTTQTPASNGKYTNNINQSVNYDNLPVDDKMIGWDWSDFNIPDNETITKVELNITAKNGEIGKWQGAFGSSTSVAPEYWTQTEDMEQTINSKSGTLTWNIDAATAAVIQKGYGGQLKFGIWWIDCTQFTIDSITVYTDANGGETTTATTAKTTAKTTTSKSTTTTSKTTASTTKKPASTTVVTTVTKPIDIPSATMYGDLNLDGRVDITDAVLLNKAVAGSLQLNGQQYANADVCTDSGVGSNDAVLLLKFLVSLVKTIPSAS